MAVLAIDFDNTMVTGEKPLPGVKEAINNLREKGHRILIHSCNNAKWIEKVLNDNDIRFDWIYSYRDGDGKPLADLYIDDKGFHFPYNGDWNVELPKILERIEGKDNRKLTGIMAPNVGEPESIARFACGLQLEDED